MAADDDGANATANALTTVEVLGTRIKGSAIAAMLPVTVLDESAISNSAVASGDDPFHSTAQMGDVSFNSAY